jgi:hypothetical protein
MEHFLLAAGALLVLGLAIDGYIFQEWLRLGDEAASREGLASTAQSLLIIGINLGFASFLIGLVDLE